MLPGMCILLWGVLGKIPRFMGEFGPRKEHVLTTDQRKDRASVPNGIDIYMVHDHIICARSGSSNPTPWRRTQSLEFLFECTVGALN
jgi:hypothetical protein